MVNEAKGEASRFEAILKEYAEAPDVTRKRLHIETVERVLGDVDKVIIDEYMNGGGGQGVVPYLPLTELRRSGSQAGTQGGSRGGTQASGQTTQENQ